MGVTLIRSTKARCDVIAPQNGAGGVSNCVRVKSSSAAVLPGCPPSPEPPSELDAPPPHIRLEHKLTLLKMCFVRLLNVNNKNNS